MCVKSSREKAENQYTFPKVWIRVTIRDYSEYICTVSNCLVISAHFNCARTGSSKKALHGSSTKNSWRRLVRNCECESFPESPLISYSSVCVCSIASALLWTPLNQTMVKSAKYPSLQVKAIVAALYWEKCTSYKPTFQTSCWKEMRGNFALNLLSFPFFPPFLGGTYYYCISIPFHNK